MSSTRLRTTHNTYIFANSEGKLFHDKSPSEDATSLAAEILLADLFRDAKSDVNWGYTTRVELIVLGNGYIALRHSGHLLSASELTGPIAFDRAALGPWETFALEVDGKSVSLSEDFVAINIGNSLKGTEIQQLERIIEIFPKPLFKSEHELYWFENTPRLYFPTSYGSNIVDTNYIVSTRNVFLTTFGHANGVLFDKDGCYTQRGFLSLRDSFPNLIRKVDNNYLLRKSIAKASNRIKGCYVCACDGNHTNYYHWVIECLLPIFVIRNIEPSVTPIFYVSETGLLPWQQQYLNLMKIDRYMVVRADITDVIALEEAVWLYKRDILSLRGSDLVEMANFIKTNTYACNASHRKKIYIKRAQGSARSITNDLELETFLIQKGFHIVELESLQVKEQVRLFHDAVLVIGAHGAGLTNILFMQKDAILVELIPDDNLSTFYWVLSSKIDVHYTFLKCETHGHCLIANLPALSHIIDASLTWLNQSGGKAPEVD